jgi:hypothetical protein
VHVVRDCRVRAAAAERRHIASVRGMTIAPDAFLTAARAARALIAESAVAQAWTRPSVLPGFTVGGLAAHLGAQVVMAAGLLTAPLPESEAVTALEHYARATWVSADRDADVNVAIRDRGEDLAREGHDALLSAVDDALAALDVGLPGADLTRSVPTPAGPWALPLAEALLTRTLEITVHLDDLATSVELPTPELPEEVVAPVLRLLVVVAARRHGQTALLRVLTRPDRAPASVGAFGPS